MIFNRNIAAPNKPVITFTIGSDTYTYIGEDIEEEGKFKIVEDGLRGWKMWIYDSLSFVFSFVNTQVEVCAVGHGGAAGNYYETGSGWYTQDHYGKPGNGGQVVNLGEGQRAFLSGDKIDISIADDKTTVSKNGVVILTANADAGAASGGEVIGYHYKNEPYYREEGGGNGQNGSYAFGDSTFDGIMYGPGGCDGPVEDYGGYKPGQTYWAPGFGGIASVSGDQKAGGKGIVLMRYKEAT